MTRDAAGAGGSGRLVAVEGIDGAGKSTVAAALHRRLEDRGHVVERLSRYTLPELTVLWRRAVFLGAVDQSGAALLAAADHLVGAVPRIRRALADGQVVVADRYVYSHLVYFGARGIPMPTLRALFEGAVVPDLILYLDVTPDGALARLRPRGKPDLWESGLDYRLGLRIGEAARACREGAVPPQIFADHFLSHQALMVELFRDVLPPDRTIRVSTDADPEGVVTRCWQELEARLAPNRPEPEAAR